MIKNPAASCPVKMIENSLCLVDHHYYSVWIVFSRWVMTRRFSKKWASAYFMLVIASEVTSKEKKSMEGSMDMDVGKWGLFVSSCVLQLINLLKGFRASILAFFWNHYVQIEPMVLFLHSRCADRYRDVWSGQIFNSLYKSINSNW